MPHCISSAIPAETEEPLISSSDSPHPAAASDSPAFSASVKRLRKPKNRKFVYEECDRASSKQLALTTEIAKEQATPVAAVRFVAVVKRNGVPLNKLLSELVKPCTLTCLLLVKFAVPIDEPADRLSVDFVLLLCFTQSGDVGLESVFDLLDVYSLLCFGILSLSTLWTGVAQIFDRNFPTKAIDEWAFWFFFGLLIVFHVVYYYLMMQYLPRRVLQATLDQSAAPGWDRVSEEKLAIDSSRGGSSK